MNTKKIVTICTVIAALGGASQYFFKIGDYLYDLATEPLRMESVEDATARNTRLLQTDSIREFWHFQRLKHYIDSALNSGEPKFGHGSFYTNRQRK